MRKVLVTGASGFIGSNLVEALEGVGIEAICPVRSERSARLVADLGARAVPGDLTKPGRWTTVLKEVDAVFHLAGLVRAHGVEDYIEHNVQATARLLAAMDRRGRPEQRLVVLSSLAAAGPCETLPGRTEDEEPAPVSHYGRTKLAVEKLAMRESDRRFTVIVRAPAVYGPRDVAFLPLFRSIRVGIAPCMGARDFPLSLIHVEDLAGALIKLAIDAAAPGVLHLSDGAAHSWCGLCECIAKTMNRRARFFPIPMEAVRCICALNGFLDRYRARASFLNPDKWNEINAQGWLSHSTHTRSGLGLHPPIGLTRGIEETLRWYRDHKWL